MIHHGIEDISVIKEILDGAQIGLWRVEFRDGEAPQMYVNETMLHLLGLEVEPEPEECYRIWYENVDPAYYGELDKAMDRLAQGEPVEEIHYLWKHPARGRIYVRCGGICDRSARDCLCLCGYQQDMTEGELARKEKEWLKDLNENITNSLGKLFDDIYRIDIEERTVLIVRSLKNLAHLEGKTIPMPLCLQTLSENFHPEDYSSLAEALSLEHIEKLKEQDAHPFVREYRRITEDGTYRWYSMTIFADRDTGDKKYAIVAFQDIEEKKVFQDRSEKAVKKAYESANQANEAKNVFLSKMSHDIRTPMNAIVGMTALARIYRDKPDRLVYYLDQIEASSQELLALVNELLDMSKLESGQGEGGKDVVPLNLPELLYRVEGIYEHEAKSKKQTLSVHCDGLRHPLVYGNRNSLQSIFSNLISNAIKYTPSHGKVTVTAGETKSNISQYRRYQFQVRDNGIGMTPEFLDKIYEPFYRGDNSVMPTVPGTGLGLTITHNLVRLMNGNLDVESKLGEGTCFTVTLDLKIVGSEVEAGPEEGDGHENLDSFVLNGRRFLLVEDNEINQEIAVEMLSMAGAEVMVAYNGEEAVEIFSEMPILYFDMVLMDIQMPVMDGYDAARAIRALSRPDASQVPIIALSANTFTDDVLKSKQAGMNDHLPKPIDMGQIVTTILKYLPE